MVSTTLTEDALVDGWGPTTILRTSDDVARAKEDGSGAIFIHGSAELARRLSEADLIDRYNLLVFPVLLGAGKSLFGREDRDKARSHPRYSVAPIAIDGACGVRSDGDRRSSAAGGTVREAVAGRGTCGHGSLDGGVR